MTSSQFDLGSTLVRPWFDLGSTLKPLNLFLLRFNERSESENLGLENREREIGWKMLFFIIWLGKENKRDKKFSPKPTFLILPNPEENVERKVLWKHFYANTPHLPTWLLPLLNPYHFCLFSFLPSLHSTPTSMFSFLFYFLIFLTWPD